METLAAKTNSDLKSGPARRADARCIALSLIAFAILSLIASKLSEGFLEADGCTHYQFARFAFVEPHYLVNIWGRPFCTALYALPAQLAGRFGVRCTSLLLALSISIIAYQIARRQNYRAPIPALALIFTLAQPMLFLHSISELTELPFAFLLGLAFLMYQRRRWMFFAILCSILPLARPEGFLFLALAGVALCGRDRIAWLLLLPIPLIAWSYIGWIVYGSPPDYSWTVWLIHNWPYAEKSTYLSGSIWHFVIFLPVIVSPIVLPAVLVGVWRQTSDATRSIHKTLHDHPSRCAMLIVAIPLAMLIGHSVLYATGRMASSGEIRYLLIASPFWAILAARGWDHVFTWRGWSKHRQAPIALFAACVPLLANSVYPVVPLRFSADWLRAKSVVEWAQSNPQHALYPRIASGHPGIFYFLSVSPTDSQHVAQWDRKLLDHPPLGGMLVWDWVYSLHNADTARVITQDELRAAGWVPLSVPQLEYPPDERAGAWKLFLSPRDVNGKPTNANGVR